MVDTPQRNPIKGASLILIDDQLNVATVCCYTEGADASTYRIRIEPANSSGPNDLVDKLRTTIDPDRDPWASLAQAIRTTVGDRGRQLDERLRSPRTPPPSTSGTRTRRPTPGRPPRRRQPARLP